MAAGLAELAGTVLHLPERELAERQYQGVTELVAEAEHSRDAGSGFFFCRVARVGDDRVRIEAVLVGARPTSGVAAPQPGFSKEGRVGVAQRGRQRRRLTIMAGSPEDGPDRRPGPWRGGGGWWGPVDLT